MRKDSSEILLSVVIISKNEEKNIANCIESVLRALKETKNSEVILADSASTDKTIEIAKRYPIKIIQIDSSSHLSPSAGRYLGFLHSNGKYIQFVDGDMTLYEDWFAKSLKFLKEDKVAGVTGITIHQIGCEEIAPKRQKNDFMPVQQQETDILTGAALFKHDVLKKVGTYNPYLYGDEEAELSCRLRRAGYKLLKIPYNMAIHHRRNISAIKQFKNALTRKYYFGCGQTLRYSIGDIPLFLLHLVRFRLYLLYITWIITGLVSVGISFVYEQSVFIFMWLAGTLTFFIIFSVKKKTIKGAFFSMLCWTLFSFGIFIGLAISPNRTELNYKVLKLVEK